MEYITLFLVIGGVGIVYRYAWAHYRVETRIHLARLSPEDQTLFRTEYTKKAGRTEMPDRFNELAYFWDRKRWMNIASFVLLLAIFGYTYFAIG